MSLFSILVDIAANTSKFESGIDRVNQKLDGFEKSIKSAIAATAEFTGITIGFETLRGAMEKALERGEQMTLLAERMHTTTENLTQLEYAAKLNNIEFTSLAGALDIMSKNVGMAAENTGRAKVILGLLKIDAKDFINLPLGQQFGIIADKIAGLSSSTEQAQVAMQIFGGEGAKLLPILNKGAEGIEALRKAADDANFTLGTDSAKKLAEGEEGVKKLSLSWTALWTQVSQASAPAITGTLDLFRKMLGGETDLEKAADRIKEITYALEKAPSGSSIAIEARKNVVALTAELETLQAKVDGVKKEGDSGLIKHILSPSTMKELADNFEYLDKLRFDALTTPIEVTAKKQGTSPMKALLDQWDQDTQTSVEKQLGMYQKLEEEITQLQETGVINAEEAAVRRNEILEREFSDVTVQGKKVIEESRKNMTEIQRIGEQGAHGLQQNFADFLFDPMAAGFNGLAKSFLDTLRRMEADAAASKLFEWINGSIASTTDNKSTTLGGLFSNLLGGVSGNSGAGSSDITNSGDLTHFGGGKAEGGPLEQNKWYIAGEHGPEPIWGGGAGAFAMGYGGGEIHYHNNQVINIGANNAVSRSEVYAAVEQGSRAAIMTIQDYARRGKMFR